jgi:hypothetical protein
VPPQVSCCVEAHLLKAGIGQGLEPGVELGKDGSQNHQEGLSGYPEFAGAIILTYWLPMKP